MAASGVLYRLRVVVAFLITALALAGVALGATMALGKGALVAGVPLSAGCAVSWFFFDAALWDNRTVSARTLLASFGVSFPIVGSSLSALMLGDKIWLVLLGFSALPTAIWAVVATVVWVTCGAFQANEAEHEI